MVLGKLPVPRRPANLAYFLIGKGPTALVVGAVVGCLDIFSLINHFSFFLSPSLSGRRPDVNRNTVSKGH